VFLLLLLDLSYDEAKREGRVRTVAELKNGADVMKRAAAPHTESRDSEHTFSPPLGFAAWSIAYASAAFHTRWSAFSSSRRGRSSVVGGIARSPLVLRGPWS